jgi:hypothetical protein
MSEWDKGRQESSAEPRGKRRWYNLVFLIAWPIIAAGFMVQLIPVGLDWGGWTGLVLGTILWIVDLVALLLKR